MMKITAVLWHSHNTTMRRAKELVKDMLEVKVYSPRFLDEGKEKLAEALEDLARADLIFLYRSTSENVWSELEEAVKKLDKPVACVAHDPALWALSTVDLEVISQCQTYISYGGEENFAQMLRYLAAGVLGLELTYAEPVFFPWEGIEPLFIAGVRREGDLEIRVPVEERCRRLAERVNNWIRLGQKPVSERKVAFILNNNPCASVEATVGGGANLDTLESVARVLHRMQEVGYRVEAPENGKELIDTIMDRKAVSEFRWTTADEIIVSQPKPDFFASRQIIRSAA